MGKQKIALLSIIGIFILLFMIILALACQNYEDEKIADDNFDSQGGGIGGGDDDDASSDDDDDDDNDDSDDDTDIPTETTIVVVQGDSSQADMYKSFFTAYGIKAVFVNEDNVGTFNFTGYSAILVTETCQFYQTSTVQTLQSTGLNIIGIYTGGAILFGKMGLYGDLAGGYSFELSKIVAINMDSKLWAEPFGVGMTSGGVITVSNYTISGLGHSNVGAPTSFITLATVWGTTGRAILSFQSNKYFLWGLQFDTSLYTINANKLLANVIDYVAHS